MADFNTFVQTELPKRPFVNTDGNAGDVLVRSANTQAVRELAWVPQSSIAPVIPNATASTVGLVKGGPNVTISTDGTLNIVGIAGAGYSPFSNTPTLTTFDYNADGTVNFTTETVGGLPLVTTYAYNGDGTVNTVTTTYDGTTRTETFTYNGNGTVASITAILS